MDLFFIAVLLAWVVFSVYYYLVSGSGLEAPSLGLLAGRPTVLLGSLAVAVAAAAGAAWVRLRHRGYRRGDHVVYMMPKYGTRPGRRAERIYPHPHGERYSYLVRKPWTVVDADSDARVEVVTPGGKHRLLTAEDPLLHRAGPWELLMLRFKWHKQFPSVA